MDNEETDEVGEVAAKSPYAGWSVTMDFVMDVLDGIDTKLTESGTESEMQAQQVLHSVATIRTAKVSLLKGFVNSLLSLIDDKDFLVDQLLRDEPKGEPEDEPA